MKHQNKVFALGAIAGAVWFGLSTWRRVRARRLFGEKIILITGGSRGFGLAMAEEFARNGARLVLTARNAQELEGARRKLLSCGAGLQENDVHTIAADLSDAEQAQQVVNFTLERFGRIDVLVNNAGVITVGPVENQSLEAFRKAMDGNFYTMLHTTLAALPGMLAQGKGQIVNITSIGAKLAVPHLLPYSASKFAALGFSQGLHAELQSKGIQVTTVCPGLMRTGSHRHALFAGDRDREYRWFSLGASLPCVSISARSAARQVVQATATGKTEIAITPQAQLAATFAQALPSLTAACMRWANTLLLPKPVHNKNFVLIPGSHARSKEWTPLIALGQQAARRYNEDMPS